MLKERGFAVTRVFLFWTLLSLGTYSEAFLGNDEDYESLNSGSSFLRERCFEYPYLPPCHYWNSLHEEVEAEPFAENFTHFNEDAIPEGAPFIDSDNSLEKRFFVFRRRNPTAQGYKRGPGFRSWGGKRNSEMSLDKRTKFTSWGGKRADYDSLESVDGDVNDKRSKFASWGGKRDYDELLEKRSKFRSWGGKRDVETPISYDQMEKRESGKDLYLVEPFKKHVPKRPQFQSWGGKRGLSAWDGFMGLYFNRNPFFEYRKLNGEEKRKFSSWGGKRSEAKRFEANLNPWKGKNLNSLKTRQIFQNWGGKRTIADDDVPETPGDVFPVKLQSQEPSPSSYDNEIPLGREKREQVIKTYNKNFSQEPRFNFNSWQGKVGEEKISR